MRHWLLIGLLAFFYQVPANAQLTAPGSAGSTGLMTGGVGASVQHTSSLFANPAGIASLTQKAITLQAENRFLLSALNTVQAGLLLPTSSGSFGLRLSHFGPNEYNEQRAALVYGRALSPVWSLGGSIHLQQQRIPEYGNRTQINVSVGLQVQLLPTLLLGAFVHNPIRQEVVAEDEFSATLVALGVRYQPSEQVALYAEVDKDIDFPARFKAGVDYQLGDFLQLRTGVRTDPVTFSFGIGVPLGDHLLIDIGAWQHQQLGTSPLFNLTYSW